MQTMERTRRGQRWSTGPHESRFGTKPTMYPPGGMSPLFENEARAVRRTLWRGSAGEFYARYRTASCTPVDSAQKPLTRVRWPDREPDRFLHSSRRDAGGSHNGSGKLSELDHGHHSKTGSEIRARQREHVISKVTASKRAQANAADDWTPAAWFFPRARKLKATTSRSRGAWDPRERRFLRY